MQVIDSHTEGEPTRLILAGGPDLGSGSLVARREIFAGDHDRFRTASICEPRGSDAMVGALLCAATDHTCAAGLIFFNNAGYLGMCGHASIGVAVSLHHLGRIGLGLHRFETPVGIVSVMLSDPHTATIENVASYRLHEGISLDVPGLGRVSGDVAWGGNWFFLSGDLPCALESRNIPVLSSAASAIKDALSAQGISGSDGAAIDHIEFVGPPQSEGANGRNFVLCSGGAYDRSPCGTGTSAKLACLAARGALRPGEIWVQESIIGSRFLAQYRRDEEGQVIPRITGSAFVCGVSSLHFDPDDPFVDGIQSVQAQT
jgi:4-hydroxyproline epimerase